MVTLTARRPSGSASSQARSAGRPPRPARTVIPYAALVYDADGHTGSTPTHGAPLTLRPRSRSRSTTVDGGQAVLHDGPAAGTEVVTVGAAERFGAELGVGHRVRESDTE